MEDFNLASLPLALIVVDMQNDFVLPTGALSVPRAESIVKPIARLMHEFHRAHQFVVMTKDWHPPNHKSFKRAGGPWPPHCIRDTDGAKFHEGLALEASTCISFGKGLDAGEEQYSGFATVAMHTFLSRLGIRTLFICGVATEYCVKSTALDARRLGYSTRVLQDLVASVDQSDGMDAITTLQEEGVMIGSSADL